MAINNSQNCVAAPELRATIASTGVAQLVGLLTYNPVIIIFDNQGSNSAQICVNSTSVVWKTFPAGEALVLDLRSAHGLAPNFTFPTNTSFYVIGTAADAFSISYVYAKNQ